MEDANAKDILARMAEAVRAKTDAALAHAIGVSPQSLSDARRKSKVPPSWAVTIAQKYQASLDWLLLGRAPSLHDESDSQGQAPAQAPPAGEPPRAQGDESMKQLAITSERLWQAMKENGDLKAEVGMLTGENKAMKERITEQAQVICNMRDSYEKQEADVGPEATPAGTAPLKPTTGNRGSSSSD